MTIKFIDGDLNLQSVTKIVNSETSPPTYPLIQSWLQVCLVICGHHCLT